MSKNILKELSEERKNLQEQDLIPKCFTTASWQVFKAKYLYEAENAREQYLRIAETAAKHLEKIGLYEEAKEKFFNFMWNGDWSPSTPTLANMGVPKRGMPVSCSGSMIYDEISSIYDARKEIALLTKNGFGTSYLLSNIRPRGTEIKSGGQATGAVPVFNLFKEDMKYVTQGNRRGAVAAYIDIEHDDFYELIDDIKNHPDDANIGWLVKDTFIEKLKNGDEEANRRYKRSLKVKCLTGKGYFIKIDAVNRKRPQAYINNNLYVSQSNLCLVGETLINIRDNDLYEEISLEDFVTKYSMGFYQNPLVKSYDIKNDVTVWSEVTNAGLTAIVEELYEIESSNGNIIKCTANHKIYTKRGYIEAKDLLESDEIIELENTSDIIYLENTSNIYSIKKINVEKTPVYDITVKDTENFFANNILVHNCTEILLFNGLHEDNGVVEDHTFTCIIASMNDARYDLWKDTDAVFWATIFLDCVAEEFIQQGKKIQGLEKAIRFTEKGRAIGLGQMGLHTYLQNNLIAFDSLQGHLKSQEIAKHIWLESERASKFLAEKLGEPLWCKGTGLRNTHRIAIAPTKTISLFVGGVSEGIGLDPKMVFIQSTAGGGQIERINPKLLSIMKEKGVYNKSNIKDISDNSGSIQHVDWLSQEEKDALKTGFEVSQRAILRTASARGMYIDQWQSLNFYFSAHEKEENIAALHQEAFEDPNILGTYYLYMESSVKASNDNEVCESCQ